MVHNFKDKQFVTNTLAAAILAGGGMTVIAQPASAEVAALEEIVVSARRRDESLQDIPDQVNVFTSQLIEDAGIDSLEDISIHAPGMFFSGDFFTTSNVLTMRGSSQSNGQSAPVAFVIDGVTLPNSVLFTQPLFDIKQVEVLRGPQGALYGRNSLGGAINISTKPPSDEFQANLKFRVQEGEDYSLSGSVSGPIVEGKLAYRLSAAIEDRDGLIDSALGHKIHDRDAQFARLKLFYTPSDTVTFDWRVAGHRENRHPLRFVAFNTADTQSALFGGDHPYSFDGVCSFPFRGGLSSTGDACPSDNLPANWIYQQPDVPDAYNDWESFTQKLNIDFEAFNFTSITDFTNTEAGGFAFLGYIRARHLPAAIAPDNSETWTQEFRLSSNSDGPLQWSGGLFWQQLEREQAVTLATPDFTTRLSGESLKNGNVTEETSFGLFGQLDYDLTDSLTLTLAARYDDVEFDTEAVSAPLTTTKSFNDFQPKVSLSYSFENGNLVYATYSEAFRPGVLNPSDLATPGNNVTDEETLKNYELGFKSSWLDRRLILNGAIYSLDIDNWQYFTFAVNPNTGAAARQLLAAPEASTFGAELAATWRPTAGLDISIGWSLTDTEVEKYDPNITTIDISGARVPATNFNGAKFLYVPEQTLNISAQYNWPITDGLSGIVRADVLWRDEYYLGIDNVNQRGERQESYSTSNLRVGVEGENWKAVAYFNNIEDEEYITHAWIGRHVGLPNSAVTPALPGYWGVELEYNF